MLGAFNQEKALVGAFSVIAKTGCGTDGALHSTRPDSGAARSAASEASVSIYSDTSRRGRRA